LLTKRKAKQTTDEEWQKTTTFPAFCKNLRLTTVLNNANNSRKNYIT
jgi:hypothetical protein